MVKYKRLTLSELKILKKQFVKYLASNSISASDWEKMKIDDIEKVDEFIDHFSDLIYENTLSKIEYLILKQKNALNCIKVNENDFDYYILTSKSSTINFKNIDLITLNEKHEDINIFYTKRNITNQSTSLVLMLEQGAEIADESLYIYLINLLKNKNL